MKSVPRLDTLVLPAKHLVTHGVVVGMRPIATRAMGRGSGRGPSLPVNAFLKKRERSSLAAAINNLLASPTFSGWRKGASLDVAE